MPSILHDLYMYTCNKKPVNGLKMRLIVIFDQLDRFVYKVMIGKIEDIMLYFHLILKWTKMHFQMIFLKENFIIFLYILQEFD